MLFAAQASTPHWRLHCGNRPLPLPASMPEPLSEFPVCSLPAPCTFRFVMDEVDLAQRLLAQQCECVLVQKRRDGHLHSLPDEPSTQLGIDTAVGRLAVGLPQLAQEARVLVRPEGAA